MSIFKASMRVILHHPVYLLIYAVFLSFMGIFIAGSLNVETDQGAFEQDKPSFAVIDRDGSDISRALVAHLEGIGERKDVADDSFAQQDAVATNLVDCLIIVEDGFGEDLLQAARTGESTPSVQVAYGYQSMLGTLASQEADRYLQLVAASAALQPQASVASLVGQADDAAAEEVAVESMTTANSATPADRFASYLQWSTYTMTASIIICVSVLMGSFNRTDLRRRNISSPLSSLKLGMGLASGCLMVTVLVWAWAIGLGLVVFGDGLSATPPLGIAAVLIASFAFALVPLSIGFLLGELCVSESISNATGNILGLIMSFLGGAWVSIDLLAPEVQAVSHFTPTYWYNQAITQAIHSPGGSLEAYGTVFADLGIVLLFAVALFAIALVVGKLRTTSATAGGNAAASAKG